MKPLLVFCITLGCTACATAPDGPTRKIEWRQFSDQAELNRVCDTRLPPATVSAMLRQRPAGRVEGCFQQAGEICIINTMKIDVADKREIHDTIGHEVRHCFEGLFHSANKS